MNSYPCHISWSGSPDYLADMLTHMLPPRQLGVTWQHVTCVLITGPRSYINWTGAIITSGLWKATLHCVTSANWLHPPQAGNKCRPYSQLVGIRRVIEVRVELQDLSTVLSTLCNLVSLTKRVDPWTPYFWGAGLNSFLFDLGKAQPIVTQ